MIDERHLLERAAGRVAPPERVMDGLVRRRDRKRRNQRIASAVLALIIAVAAIGSLLAAFHNAREHLPARQIDRTNVSQLERVWTASIDGPASTIGDVPGNTGHIVFSPIVAGGEVFVAANRGKVYAFPAECSSACRPDWFADTGGRISRPPTVADGVVYVATDDGSLLAYSSTCGNRGGACTPEWTADLGGIGPCTRPCVFDITSSSPVIADGLVYVQDTQLIRWKCPCRASTIDSTFYAFRVGGCGTYGKTCRPTWSVKLGQAPAPPHYGFVFASISAPVVSNGVVYTGPYLANRNLDAFDAKSGRLLWTGSGTGSCHCGTRFTTPVVAHGQVYTVFEGRLYAFPANCRTDGGACSPRWTADSPDDFMSLPVAENGVVYVGTAALNGSVGHVFAFSSSCGTGGERCQPIWSATIAGEQTVIYPVVADGNVFATSNLAGTMSVYSATCGKKGATCDPLWARTVTDPEFPVINNGLVYTSELSPDGAKLSAFTESCSNPCEPIWTGTVPSPKLSAPTIDEDKLYVASSDGHVYAFGLRTGTRAKPASKRSAAAFYSVIAIVALGVLAFRVWRRQRSA